MEEVKLARTLASKYRRTLRFVESDQFQCAFKKYPNIKVLVMIQHGDVEGLRKWAYNTNPMVDAPLRWLREQAKIYRIKDYSRKTKVQLVDELTRINKLPTE